MKRQTLILTITKNLNLLRVLRNRYQVMTLDSEAKDLNENKLDRLLKMVLPDLIIVDVDAPLTKNLRLSLQIRNKLDVPLLMISSGADNVRRVDFSKSSGIGDPIDEKGILAQIEKIFSRNRAAERLVTRQAG